MSVSLFQSGIVPQSFFDLHDDLLEDLRPVILYSFLNFSLSGIFSRLSPSHLLLKGMSQNDYCILTACSQVVSDFQLVT